MAFTRRNIGRLVLSALVLGPALKPAQAADAALPLVLEEFFAGRTRGEGAFVSDLFGIERRLTVETSGRFDGRTLVLTEKIAYADGAREVAVWRFDKTGPASYDGQRTDVSGVVPIRVVDGTVRMGYVAAVRGTEGKVQKLRFADVLTRTGPRTVVNTARVSFLGITVGRVEITFTKL
jgi:hypothetical protein